MDLLLERETDEMLLARTSANSEAFGAFYRRHENAMLVFFMRRTRNPEVAADLTAEVFAAALECAGRFQPRESPAVAWLYGIANNKLASSRRRGRVDDRARRRLGMVRLELDDEALERVEALMDASRWQKVLDDLLAELPPDQHDAVRARVMDERSYDEMAEELKCSKAAVRQRVSRGLSTLRRQLSEEIS